MPDGGNGGYDESQSENENEMRNSERGSDMNVVD